MSVSILESDGSPGPSISSTHSAERWSSWYLLATTLPQEQGHLVVKNASSQCQVILASPLTGCMTLGKVFNCPMITYRHVTNSVHFAYS